MVKNIYKYELSVIITVFESTQIFLSYTPKIKYSRYYSGVFNLLFMNSEGIQL
jgi:hypothetical protein